MSNPEILHLAKYYHPVHGGMETATRDLAEAAVDLGFRVSCQSAGLHRGRRAYELNGVRVRSYPQRWKLLSAPLGPSLFFQRLGREGIVHVHLPNPLVECRVLLALLLAPRFRRRLVPFFHAFPVGQGRLGRFWFRFVTAPILDRVPHALISNPYLLDSFPALERWREKFVVMPFAADPISAEEWGGLRTRRLGSRTVVALGRMVPYKGFPVLLRAWSRLRGEEAFRGFRLRLIGSGPQEGELRDLVRALGLSDAVEFCGDLPDEQKWQALREACALVAPSVSRAETFGISILEAMSVGLPVVTTRLDTGVAALARGGACGGVAEPGDAAGLAAGLKSVLGNVGQSLDTFGRANLAFVQSQHSRENLKSLYGSFLGRFLNGS